MIEKFLLVWLSVQKESPIYFPSFLLSLLSLSLFLFFSNQSTHFFPSYSRAFSVFLFARYFLLLIWIDQTRANQDTGRKKCPVNFLSNIVQRDLIGSDVKVCWKVMKSHIARYIDSAPRFVVPVSR